MEYQSIRVYHEQSGKNDLIIVEDENNTFRFYNCSMAEIGAFIREVKKEEE